MSGALKGLFKTGDSTHEKVLNSKTNSEGYAEYLLGESAKLFKQEKVDIVCINIKSAWDTKTTSTKTGFIFKTKKYTTRKINYSKDTKFQGYYTTESLPHLEIRVIFPESTTKRWLSHPSQGTFVIDQKFWNTIKTTDCGGKIPVIKFYKGKKLHEKFTLNKKCASAKGSAPATAPAGDTASSPAPEKKFQTKLSTRIHDFFSKLIEDRKGVYMKHAWPYDKVAAESQSIASEKSAAYGHIKALKDGADGAMLLERYLSDVRMKFICQNFADLTITKPAGSI